jgi:shikimate kinase
MLIYISGLPRVGKTTFGRLLAKALSLPFFDLDEEIVRNSGAKNCRTLYREKGAQFFRNLEEKTLEELEETGVIALGGGSLLSEKNRSLVKKGVTLFLTTPTPILRKRLLSNTPAYMEQQFDEEFKCLFKERETLLQTSADIQIDLSLGLDAAIERVRELING